MSAAKMQADSTQESHERRKRKIKKSNKTKETKTPIPEDDDSDLDLRRDLRPISSYMASRSAMVEEMFRAVRGSSLTRALPELLKSVPLEELKALCVEQLEVMSKKRITRILAGEESANISSSGTEDDTEEEESAPDPTPAVPADSTGQSDAPTQGMSTAPSSGQLQPTKSLEQKPSNFVQSFAPVAVKQEPPDTPPSKRRSRSSSHSRSRSRSRRSRSRSRRSRSRSYSDRSRSSDSDDSYYRNRRKSYRDESDYENDRYNERYEKEQEVEDEEDYTTGSEDGELVVREDQPPESFGADAREVRKEASDNEEQVAAKVKAEDKKDSEEG